MIFSLTTASYPSLSLSKVIFNLALFSAYGEPQVDLAITDVSSFKNISSKYFVFFYSVLRFNPLFSTIIERNVKGAPSLNISFK